jgi:betaine-aldehyde dehydrogenase
LSRQYYRSKSGRRFDVINPATGGVLAQVHGVGTAEVDQAVKVAAEAQHSWTRRTPAERGAVLRRASLAIAHHMQELAELESAEMGKPVSQALGFDLFAAVGLFDFFGGLVHAVTGDVRNQRPTVDVTEHHPFGVVASIIPFNWSPIHAAYGINRLPGGDVMMARLSPGTPTPEPGL